jgi:hypothetical protein
MMHGTYAKSDLPNLPGPRMKAETSVVIGGLMNPTILRVVIASLTKAPLVVEPTRWPERDSSRRKRR